MQTPPKNKAAHAPKKRVPSPKLVNGREGQAEELVKCKCGTIVPVPSAGTAECQRCGQPYHWPSRFERPHREKVITSIPR